PSSYPACFLGSDPDRGLSRLEELVMHTRLRFFLAGSALVAVAALAAPTAASADGGSADGDSASDIQRCVQQFDEAQRVDMESFRDYDLETWKAGHDDDAITVLAQGLWFQGRDRIAAVLHRHFEDREAIWTWTELTRAV